MSKNRSLSLGLYHRSRNMILVLAYSFFSAASLWIAYELRFDFNIDPFTADERLVSLFLVIPLKLVCLWAAGQFRGLLSYFRIPDLNRVFLGLLAASTILLVIRVIEPFGLFSIPRGVLLTDLLLSLILIVGFRVGLRVLREKYNRDISGLNRQPKRIGIFGAGSTGAALAAEYLAKPHLGVRPVVFFDDDGAKIGKDAHSIPILGGTECIQEACERFAIQTVVIAIPSLNARRIREILEAAGRAKLETTIIPSLHELSSGRVKIEEMRRVEVEDLLGREPVSLDNEPIRSFVEGCVVMVSGAGGSIGSEVVRQVATFNPKRILLLDHSELAVFTIEAEMLAGESGAPVTALVADVSFIRVMEKLLERYKPSVIFHAAAYKHVPLMETQPWEAVMNNTFGTIRLARLAREAGVERFVLISTDKAINPTSVMGASKRLAEIGLKTLCRPAPSEPGSTRFMAVRFGNVLGSSGSVIPTFRKQIARGGPVTVTHPEVTRYFMTIPEAVGLVLQSASLGKGGEIFLLDMGEPVKIMDLARQMIQLSGFEPETEIEIEITGLRPGEKMYEELNYQTEQSEETTHPRIRSLRCPPPDDDGISAKLAALENDLFTLSATELKQRLKDLVPEYSPYLE